MLAFAQLTWRDSLRDIETCLASSGPKALSRRHLEGFAQAPSARRKDSSRCLLTALCGNQFFLANNCPATLRLAQRCFGNKIVKRRHETRSAALPPPQIFCQRPPGGMTVDQVTFVPTEGPVISAETLTRLPTGAVWAKLVDGSVHKFQCAFD